jgi:peptidoglycan/xylan/chitin deacetylase (PgdA/CDA1 family)
MTPHRYGPLAYVPITRRPKLTWPDSARVVLWVNPNIEFFGLDDIMPGNQNDRVPRDHAKIPNVRNWAVRDYGNRVGIWRIMEVLTRSGIRASAALNSGVCDHHPEIIEEAGRLGWELIGHNQTNALRLTEMDAAEEREAVHATIDRIEAAPASARSDGSGQAWPRPGTRSITSPKRAFAMSATGLTTTSRIYSRSAIRRWCHCPIRSKPTTCRPISR